MTGTAPHAHVVVWISGEDVLLIRRVRRGRVNYLAPGVAVAEVETPGVAAGRAARTLFGIEAAVGEVLHAQVFAGVDHFFFAARALSEFDDSVELPESDDFELDGELDGTFEIARLPATTLLAYDDHGRLRAVSPDPRRHHSASRRWPVHAGRRPVRVEH